MFWVYQLPLWLLCVLCVGISVLVSITGVLVARRRAWVLGPEDTAGAFAIHTFIGVVYAVSLGLIVVSVQSSYDKVAASVVQEASMTSNLFRTLEAIDEPERSQIQGLLLRYIDRVINVEWPANQRGDTSELTTQTVDSIARAVIVYQPRSAHAELIYNQLVPDTHDLLDARRTRIYLGGEGVGPVIWLVVVVGAAITLGFTWFFYIPSRRAHLMASGVAAALVGLMMFLILGLDHPAWGSLSVSPGAFVTVQANLVRWRAETDAGRSKGGGQVVAMPTPR